VKHKIWWVFAVILVLAATALVAVRSAEDRVTANMLSRAGRFAIPAEWKLTRETVRPERFMCISTNPCPSLHRTWDTGKELTDDDVTAVFSGVGFEMKADGPCKRPSNVIGKTPSASSRGRTASTTTSSASPALPQGNLSSSP